jgi:hypothetical protein
VDAGWTPTGGTPHFFFFFDCFFFC